jgi:hypothetical protein
MLGARFVPRSQWARARAPAPHEQWKLSDSAHYQDRKESSLKLSLLASFRRALR